ncbi:RBBP9/YdeN family alpha/beta hydrolase [Acetobacter sp. UBA5411]|uniref:RBBP9/YdeN family alpha/beta hydrolase n=1 Tax=Acetobacter sp. UBA5411 TaxID=1945905 RepID=UPI0025C71935|nr:alpha/beta fold hydrolase [Acetobacter sp. UBA5411]
MTQEPAEQYVIIHGYTANPQANWFPWLATELEKAGATVTVPAMPSPFEPRLDEWLATVNATVSPLKGNVTLIGHSLGCVTLLRYLMSCPDTEKIPGYVLVSGFDRTLSTLPALSSFTEETLDYDALRSRFPFRVSIFSDNDSIVDPKVSRDLAVSLDTEEIEIPSGGHFLDREGFTQLPALLQALQKRKEILNLRQKP